MLENLQEYASRAVFEHLKQPQCSHESLVKIGGVFIPSRTIDVFLRPLGYILG